jgi:AcrR family transcriptional regulator
MSDTVVNDNTTQEDRMREAIRRRREQEKQDLRQAILQAAGELFLEKGYKDVSMRQVAERIGYSATTIYLYFENKDDLMFAVVDQGFDHFSAQLAAAAESTDDPRERLKAIGRAYVGFGLNNPMHYEMMFMRRIDFLFACREGETQPRIAAFNVLRQSVQAAMDAGVLAGDDVLVYSNALWAQVHGIVSMRITMPQFNDEMAWKMLGVMEQTFE